MQLFKSKPSLVDGEKSRIELHLQQISQSIGGDRFLSPVLPAVVFLEAADPSRRENPSVQELTRLIGDHLCHDVSGLVVKTLPQQLEKCGGGGG